LKTILFGMVFFIGFWTERSVQVLRSASIFYNNNLVIEKCQHSDYFHVVSKNL